MPKKKNNTIDLGFNPSEYQERIFDFVQHGVGNAVVKARAGCGKCLGYNTEVLMYDGSIKKVQDIKLGDLLMGDDSKPRKVLSTNIGEGNLKRIIPKKGNSWVCNDAHILTLDKYEKRWNGGSWKCKTIDISIDELEKINPSKHKDGDYRKYKLLKTGVDFQHKDIDFDPWLYGIWLGDGTTQQAYITNVDEEIINKIKEVVPSNHYVEVKKYKNKSPKIGILSDTHKVHSNKFRNFIRKSSDENGKFINKNYLINDKDIRLKLLAGIIDSDGYLARNNYYISTKFKSLCDDIIFLARSLGFGAYYSYRNKTCYNNDVTKKYYHIIINGDLSQVPVVLARKKAGPRLIAKNPLHVGFRIDDEGYGKYYGFTLDGNGRFLLGDFTVTHNTSTITSAMKLVPKTKKCLFIAFNKSIVNELTRKLDGYTNCTVKTIHSLGYLIVRRNLGNDIEIDEYKYRTYLKQNINELTSIESDVNLTNNMINDYIDSITMLIDYSRFNLAQSIREIEEVAVRYDIPVSFDECEVALKCLEWGKKNYNTIDYTDMVWLPYELSMRPSGLQFDWIFFDEAQDASKMAIELFTRCFKRGTRFVSVLDENQCINLFAGSSLEALDYMCNYPNTKTFSLPVSYRCAKKITEFANQLVPDMKYRDDAPQGIVMDECHVSDIKDGDMVLARSKSPLIKLYTKLLRRGVNCYIKGQDIAENLIAMLEEVNGDELNVSLNKDGVFVRLFDKMFSDRNKLMEKRGLDLNDATLSMNIMNMYDSINSLTVLAEKCNNKKDLIDCIRHIFKDEALGVCLSTVHKAKGLEAENVYILCHSMMPSKMAHHEWEKIQERNVQYVAYTRAKNKLGFISEKEIPPSGSMSEPSSVINELKYIENKICRVLGKEPMQPMNETEIAKLNLKSVTEIHDFHQNDNKTDITKNQYTDDSNYIQDDRSDDLLNQLMSFEYKKSRG